MGESRKVRHTGVDLELIHALREAPRASIAELSGRLQLPRATVSELLRELVDSGTIRVSAAVHPYYVGQNVIAHTSIAVSDSATEVARFTARLPHSALVSAVSGRYDLIVELRAQTHDELYAVLAQIRAHSSVTGIETSIYSHIHKGYVNHESYDPITIDEIDEELVALLQSDGRATYQELSTRTNLSASAVRTRVHKLLDSRIIKIGVIEKRGAFGRRATMGVGISLGDDGARLMELISGRDYIEFATETVGRYDAIITIVAGSLEDSLEILDWVRHQPEVRGIETWTHLNAFKEEYASRP